MSESRYIRACYRIQGDPVDARRVARSIAYEQTVELPAAQVDGTPAGELVGRVGDLSRDPGHAGTCRVWIDYPELLASGQLAQLLNLLFGNASMYRGVRLLEVTLSGHLLARWRGPGFGTDGLRRLTGVYGRPLLATAIKPRGSSLEALAGLAGAFARGGGDIVKDDQNLVHDNFDDFRTHVDACAKAVEQANAASGRLCLYLPHLAGPDEELERRAEFVRRRGLYGVLMCPLALGLDRARALAERYRLLFMAHPALSGGYTNGNCEGIAPGVLLGTLFRLAGADLSVFPAPGGRFAVSPGDCADIASALRTPLGGHAPALPAPGGGLQRERVIELADAYGAEAAWLLGGSLRGAAEGVEAATGGLLEFMSAHFDVRYEAPQTAPVSVCELPGSGDVGVVRSLLPVGENFHWSDREDQRYKSTQTLPFRGVRRVELVGRQGEPCSFELRYFELEPGGYTSHEKHVHTHVLIGARGRGVVVMDGERVALNPDDVAYVAPLRAHQLRNESDRPFGFYCIVDRDRDRPMVP